MHADRSSPYRQILPTGFVKKLNCPLPKVLYIQTHVKLYTVFLCDFDDGDHQGFHGEGWEQLYRDMNIYDECMLVVQHYWNDDMFELTVYTPEGELHSTVNHDSKQLFDHPYILFPDEEVTYNGYYQDIMSFDVHAASFLVTNIPVNENVHFKDQETTDDFKQKLDDKVLAKSALHIPVGFVRKHKLYQYPQATIICGLYKDDYKLVAYKDDRRKSEAENVHVVLRGKWKDFKKETKLKKKRSLKLVLDLGILREQGNVVFNVV